MFNPTRRQLGAGLLSGGFVALTSVRQLDSAANRQPVRERGTWQASYLSLESSGELARREAALRQIYKSCRLCPRQCGVNRSQGEKGVCQGTNRARVSSAHPHYGEEAPLTGRRGSGTVFFSNCNLLCAYCQNWEIAHRGDGSLVSDESLARLMVELQELGCHNINLVTPTHIVPNIVSALRVAIRRGLNIPLVYNCGGYEPVEILKLLDGIVDIYLPDFKYADGRMAARYSTGAQDYPEVAAAAIQEMHRQVGGLVTDEHGVAMRGLMIRHLVLPQNIGGTDRMVKFVAEKLTPSTYVNLMAQYRPEHRAKQYPEINRRISRAEYQQAIRWARDAGLTNVATG